MDLFNNLTLQWIVLPVLITLLRIADVSIGTVRIILLSKGLRQLAPVFGFFEVLIWLVAIRFVLHNVSSPIHYIAYAGGFAIGTYIGMIIEDRLSLGNLMVRIVTRQGGDELVGYLREHGYRVTDLPARGNNDKVHVIFTIIKKHKLKDIQRIIGEFNPQAFYSVEDVRFVSDTSIFGRAGPLVPRRHRPRKGK